MAKTIEPKLMKIGEYLKLEEDTVFVIPEYQRPYSWGIDNCDKLWQDIVYFNHNGGKDSYFFGTIILSCQDNDTKYELIDGQQRTTTFLLLLKALLLVVNEKIDKINDNDEEASGLLRGLKERRRKIIGILYKAEAEQISERPDVQKDSNLYLNLNILKNNSNNEQHKDELDIILKAKDFQDAEQHVYKFKYKQKDNVYTNFFRNFKFFYNKIIELESNEVSKIAKTILENCEVIEIKSWIVEQAITMFNSLNSDGMPLNDADIISAKLFATSKTLKQDKEFSGKWKELLDEVNSLKAKGILDIDSILTQYMYLVRAVNKEINSTGSIDVTVPGVRRYFTEINKELISNPIKTCSAMLTLAKIWTQIVNKPIVNILLKLNENAKLFLGCFFNRFIDEPVNTNDVEILSEAMVKLFAILELIDAGYSSKNFKTFLFGESVKLIDKNVEVSAIVNDFKNHIAKCWSKDDIKANIKDYDKNLLVYLNEFIFAKDNNLSFSLENKYDIEHIMPASGHNIASIQADAKVNSKEEFYEIVNKLGNKILLEQKINRSVSNDWFRTKVHKSLGGKFCYKDSNYPIALYLAKQYENVEKPTWDKTDIEKATEKVAERISNFIFD